MHPTNPQYFHASALILAAGASRRMGQPKAFLPFGETTFLGEILRAARHHDLSPLVIVTNEDLRERMARETGDTRLLINPDPEQGQLSSLKIGLEILGGTSSRGLILYLLDHPGALEERTARLLEAARAQPDSIHIAAFEGAPGHPLYLPRTEWGGLGSWTGPQGARGYLETRREKINLVETGRPETLWDIDTPGDYRQISSAP